MLTSATLQGGQNAVPDFGCKTPPSRLVLPPWLPIRPQRKGHHGLALPMSAAGYEFAGRTRPERRGAALDRSCALHASPDVDWNTPRRRDRPRLRPVRGPTAARARAVLAVNPASLARAAASRSLTRGLTAPRGSGVAHPWASTGQSAPSGRTSAPKPMTTRTRTKSKPIRNPPLTNEAPYESGGGAGGETLGRRGFSNDHRPDLNQTLRRARVRVGRPESLR